MTAARWRTRGRAVLCLLVFAFAGSAGAGRLSAAPSTLRLRDLDNALVDPFQALPSTKATVFVFASVSCPISNRYAPEVRRLHDAFSSNGVTFWLVYPNPAESAADIRAHLKAFGYPVRALRDPAHDLAKITKVSVTPEAAVYDARRSLVYHGRIDDRYVSVGVERPAPTRRDLQDVLTSVLAGTPVSSATQPAVGCFIADFVQ
jgi:hypothetical protein